MPDLKYLVIEYAPQIMHGSKAVPVRIYGHYSCPEAAKEVAELWTEQPLGAETRIVVAEIHLTTKVPKHWEMRELEEAEK